MARTVNLDKGSQNVENAVKSRLSATSDDTQVSRQKASWNRGKRADAAKKRAYGDDKFLKGKKI